MPHLYVCLCPCQLTNLHKHTQMYLSLLCIRFPISSVCISLFLCMHLCLWHVGDATDIWTGYQLRVIKQNKGGEISYIYF
ncbi:Uncharacterized protein TCM_007219 [Theobroma cacao]|uniref:Uncharacterized protein n=1 Tax=Theobroma cacao TaxID=3641 RepID=A0A061E1E8_THECC|nr:Uncharacterized protein TCM_007219 [Theobroma cacao]